MPSSVLSSSFLFCCHFYIITYICIEFRVGKNPNICRNCCCLPFFLLRGGASRGKKPPHIPLNAATGHHNCINKILCRFILLAYTDSWSTTLLCTTLLSASTNSLPALAAKLSGLSKFYQIPFISQAIWFQYLNNVITPWALKKEVTGWVWLGARYLLALLSIWMILLHQFALVHQQYGNSQVVQHSSPDYLALNVIVYSLFVP